MYKYEFMNEIIHHLLEKENFKKFCMVRSHWIVNYLMKYLSQNCDVKYSTIAQLFLLFFFKQNRFNN